MTTTKQIAETILAQLGGSKFIAMTGAGSFSHGNFSKTNHAEPGLSMRIGRNPKRVMGVIVTLNDSDTYRVRFLRTHKVNGFTDVQTTADVDGVYCDMLREVFERHTGLYTSLGTMGR